WYFLFRNVAYVALPRNWGGLCALVLMNASWKAQHAPFSRSKWAVMPEVKRWGGHTTNIGVLWEFRIWGGGEKFMQSLFPWVGLAEIRDHIESNRYALLRLLNSIHQLANGTVRELTELRNVVLQNRVVLDFLIASHGGFCKIIGSTCCTFVPDETETGGTISDALRELEELKNYADSGTHGSYSFNFLTWLTSVTWWNLLLRIGTPILGFLILFCLFKSCIIPCLRSMVLKTFSTAVISYQLMKTTSDTHEDDLFHMDEDALKKLVDKTC
uniref:ENV1 protein n=1 Tax=Poecilia formosa TaxID=48698 RepID=A0A087Y9F2_POEFO